MFLLPAWYTILKELDLPPKLILRDISTQWNSSCDLMGFAVEYHEAMDRIAGDQKFDLRNYEMSEDEWEIADNLHSALQVSQNGLCNMVHTDHSSQGLEGCNRVLFLGYTKPCHCDPSHGPYRPSTGDGCSNIHYESSSSLSCTKRVWYSEHGMYCQFEIILERAMSATHVAVIPHMRTHSDEEEFLKK